MTDKYIISKSEIEAAFKTVSQCKTADYCEGFNDALKAILDNAQVVNSEAVYQTAILGTWIDTSQVEYIKYKGLKRILFTTPQPAPDTVPRAEYNKLLNVLKEATEDIADWGSYASDYFQQKQAFQALIAKYNAIIAEAEGKS